MAEHILEIASNGLYVHASRGFVIISENKQEQGRVPIDTVACLLIHADGVTLSKTLFARLAEANIPVVICGKNYAPVSIAAPVSSHYKQLEIAQNQVACPPVLRKQLWQKIIQTKIANQAEVVRFHRPEALAVYEKLLLLTRKVKSGDKDNTEAYAARLYWTGLFGKDFFRNPELDGINALLNYGYAIIRSSIIRAICAAGLLPLFGLHHRNKYNAFCLADDLIEPFRPIADAIIAHHYADLQKGDLTPEKKRVVSTLLVSSVYNGDNKSSFIPMTHSMAKSLAQSYQDKALLLEVPSIRPQILLEATPQHVEPFI